MFCFEFSPWSLSLCLSFCFFLQVYQHHNHLTTHWGDSLIFAAVCFFIAMMVIGFFTGLVLVAVDSVYVCYSFDLEASAAFRDEVHYVYNDVMERQPVREMDSEY